MKDSLFSEPREEKGLTKKTRLNQKAASGFAASKCAPPTDVGLMFSCKWLWSFSSNWDSIEVEGADAIARALPALVAMKWDISKYPETKGNLNVQNFHLDQLASFSKNFRTTTDISNANATLALLNCRDGVASSSSSPDGYAFEELLDSSEIVLRAIFEVKHSTDSPEEMLVQAFVEATNVALAQLRLGVAWQKVCVPIVISNGRLMQFACCEVLEPSFPRLIVVSKVLDLWDVRDCQEAGVQLAKVVKWCSIPLHIGMPCPSLILERSLQVYHTKSLTNFFCVASNLDASLLHMFRLLDVLFQSSEAKRYVVFPLTMVMGATDERTKQDHSIVFPNLCEEGYTLGFPVEEGARKKVLLEIEVAMKAFHRCGVVHMDFYPSNIMWKSAGDGSVLVKVIDWDAAHAVDEPFLPKVKHRLEELRLMPHLHTALPDWDELHFALMLEHAATLVTDDKVGLDIAFKLKCQEYVLTEGISNLAVE